MWPLTSGANALTTSRTADGKTLTPRTISMSSVRPMQRTRGPVRPHGHGLVRTTTWSRVRKRSSGAARWRRCVRTSSPVAPSLERRARRRVSGSISSAWTKPRAPRCIPSCSSHSPHSETPMSPMPIASVTRAPQPSSSARAERGLAAARLAGDEDARDARGAQVDVARGRPLDAGARRRTASARRPRARAAGSRAPAARCCRCRPGCGRGRCARTTRAPRRRRTGPRCRSRRCAGRARRPDAA